MYHWQVKVPTTGNLDRVQAWAALRTAVDSVRNVVLRVDGGAYPSSTGAALTAEEGRNLVVALRRLARVADALDPNVLDRMAEVVSGNGKAADAELANLPEDVYEVVDDYCGDVAGFLRSHSDAENLVLAFATLQAAAGLDGESMGGAIRKVMGQPDRHGSRYCRVWTCPVCEGFTKQYQRENKKPCRRCCGWGYVFGDEPVEENAALEAAQAEEQEAAESNGSVDS